MIPDEALQTPETRAAARAQQVEHAAVGKPVKLAAMPDPRYPGLGAKSLVDGRISEPDHTSGLWLGYHGDDLEAVIDLGRAEPIAQVGVRFLQSSGVGIYLPNRVLVEVSSDGKSFGSAEVIEPGAGLRTQDNRVHTVYTEKLHAPARYVRVRAENFGTIPAGHRAAGLKAWLFVDEILIDPAPAEPRTEDRP
jgi:hexosaminidase